MKIANKLTGAESEITNDEWEQMKNQKVPGDPRRTWASTHRIVSNGEKNAAKNIPAEMKRISPTDKANSSKEDQGQ